MFRSVVLAFSLVLSVVPDIQATTPAQRRVIPRGALAYVNPTGHGRDSVVLLSECTNSVDGPWALESEGGVCRYLLLHQAEGEGATCQLVKQRSRQQLVHVREFYEPAGQILAREYVLISRYRSPENGLDDSEDVILVDPNVVQHSGVKPDAVWMLLPPKRAKVRSMFPVERVPVGDMPTVFASVMSQCPEDVQFDAVSEVVEFF